MLVGNSSTDLPDYTPMNRRQASINLHIHTTNNSDYLHSASHILENQPFSAKMSQMSPTSEIKEKLALIEQSCFSTKSRPRQVRGLLQGCKDILKRNKKLDSIVDHELSKVKRIKAQILFDK